jgi:hypothetical protein
MAECIVSTSSGALYDGNGKRLEGDGPDSALELMQSIEYKAFLYEGTAPSGPIETAETDRFLLVPDDFIDTKSLSISWILDLAKVLTMGGRVGIMSRYEASMAAVVRILSAPDALLASYHSAVDAAGRRMPTPPCSSKRFLTVVRKPLQGRTWSRATAFT